MRLAVVTSALALALAAPAFAAAPPAAPTAIQKASAPSRPVPAVRFNTPANIRKAEQKLKDIGKYSGPVDGRSSASFRTSLMTYQKENKLSQTGRLNPQTIKSLGV